MTSQLVSTKHTIKKLVGKTHIDNEDPYPLGYEANDDF